MIWIITSIVLYLLGIVPTWVYCRHNKSANDPDWVDKIVVVFWFVVAFIFIIDECVKFIKSLTTKKVVKCLLPILFISVVACNDEGGPAPDYVKRHDPEEQKYIDSILNVKQEGVFYKKNEWYSGSSVKKEKINDRAEHHNKR